MSNNPAPGGKLNVAAREWVPPSASPVSTPGSPFPTDPNAMMMMGGQAGGGGYHNHPGGAGPGRGPPNAGGNFNGGFYPGGNPRGMGPGGFGGPAMPPGGPGFNTHAHHPGGFGGRHDMPPGAYGGGAGNFGGPAAVDPRMLRPGMGFTATAPLGMPNAGGIGIGHPPHMGGPMPMPLPQSPATASAANAPPAAPVTKPAVLVFGAPKTGKTKLAEAIAGRNRMTLVTYRANEKVGDNLARLKAEIKGATGAAAEGGFVLDSFGCESQADIFYLYSALKEVHVGVAFVIYFNLDVANMPKNRIVPSDEMHRHAVAYEVCQRNFSHLTNQFCIVNCSHEEGARKTEVELQGEVFSALKDLYDPQFSPKAMAPRGGRPAPLNGTLGKIPIELKPFPLATAGSSELVEDFTEFQTILKDLGKALDLDLESIFPPRNVRSILDYSKFVRFYGALPRYKISCVTECARVVWFKHRNGLYYLPESSQHLMRFTATGVASNMVARAPAPPEPWKESENPVSWAVEAEIIPDDISGDGTTQATEIPVVRDFLLHGVQRCTGMSREKRLKLNPQPHPDAQAGNTVLITRNFNVPDIEGARKFAMRIVKSTPVTGYRFDHPGPYAMGRDDLRSFIWFENAPPIVVRLWDSHSGKDGWHFQMYCLTDAPSVAGSSGSPDSPTAAAAAAGGGEEPLYGCTLFVPFEEAEEHAINDGQLVEVFYDAAKPGQKPHPTLRQQHAAAIGAAAAAVTKIEPLATGAFTFSRRRKDVYWPMYKSAVVERLKWKKWEQCKKLCANVKECPDTWFDVDGTRSAPEAASGSK
jgi:hypothetical protein